MLMDHAFDSRRGDAHSLAVQKMPLAYTTAFALGKEARDVLSVSPLCTILVNIGPISA